jgi:hypothetical protein
MPTHRAAAWHEQPTLSPGDDANTMAPVLRRILRTVPPAKAVGSGKGPVVWTMVTPPGDEEQVLRGREGWLFLQRDTNDIVGQHTGRVHMGRPGRHAWRRVLSQRMSLVRRLGIVWVSQIAPDKESVYPEYLPPEIQPSRVRPVHELLRVGKSVGAPLTYPLEALVAAKGEGPLYFPTDTHWNQRGAYRAYRALCRELVGRGQEPTVVGEDGIEWITQPHIGDLGSKLKPHVEGAGLFAQLDRHSSRLVFDNLILNHGRVMIFEQDRPAGPSCVAFGESFANQLLVFLKESFRRLVFVHTSMLIPEVIGSEAPDVVISLPLERFLISVPSDRDALAKLTDTIRQKLAHGNLREFPMPYLRDCPRPEPAVVRHQIGTSPWQLPCSPNVAGPGRR